MIIPDFSGAWSALDAHERPVVSFHEMCTFLAEAGELRGPAQLYLALEEMVQEGTVWVALSPKGPPRYALRSRLVFRREERRGRWQPWAS